MTLAETRSFVDAAKRLDLAQSTVSLQVKKLETALGVVLLERGHGGCELTPRGRSVLPQARALLQSAEALSNAVDGTSITIGCSGNVAAYYISEDLKRFIDTYGLKISWDLTVAPNPEVMNLLLSGAVDIAAMEWPPNDPRLVVRAWRTEPLVVIVPNEHPLAGRGSITASQLTGLDLIGGEPGSGTGTLLKQALGARVNKLKISRNLGSTEAVKSAVRAGLGCSIVLAGAVRGDVETGRISTLSLKGTPLEKTLYVAIPKGLPETSLAARMTEFLDQTCTERWEAEAQRS